MRRKYRTAEEFKKLWQSGAPVEEIRDMLGYSSVHSIYSRATALRLPNRGRDNPKWRAMLPYADDIIYAREAGLSTREIAAEAGVSRTYPNLLYRRMKSQ